MKINNTYSRWMKMNHRFEVAAKTVQNNLGLGRDCSEYLDELCNELEKLEYIFERNKEWQLIGRTGIADIFIRRPYQAMVLAMTKEKIEEQDEELGRKWRKDVVMPIFLVNFGSVGGPEMRAYI